MGVVTVADTVLGLSQTIPRHRDRRAEFICDQMAREVLISVRLVITLEPQLHCQPRMQGRDCLRIRERVSLVVLDVELDVGTDGSELFDE